MMAHQWVYRGVVYRTGRQIGGSSAREISYYDCYFCKRCLGTRTRQLDVTHDSYQRIRFDAKPAPDDNASLVCGM